MYRNNLETVVPVAPEVWPDIERDRRHLHDMTSGVGVPLVQAVVTGFSLACAVGVYCWLLKVPDCWKYAVGTFAGVQACAWLFLLAKWLRLVEPVERFLNRDIDGDGVVGEPQTIRIELKHNERRTQFIDLPFADRLPDFSRAVLSGTSISESAWTGSNALFSKREFFTLRDELLKSGVIRWRNEGAPAQGLELTPSGKAVVRYLANPPT